MKKAIKKILIGSLILMSLGFVKSEKLENNLNVILQTEKSIYPLGMLISMDLTITNKKPNEAIKLTFSSNQRYDFIIKKQDKEIWRWSKDKVFALMLGEIVLEPEESLRYRETWDQRDNEGKPILPGRYEIIGILKTYPEIVSEPVIVEIKTGFAASK